MFKLLSELLSPEDGKVSGGAAPIGGKEDSVSDVIDLLNADDEPEVIDLEPKPKPKAKEKEIPADKEDKEESEEEPEEIDELKEIEEELNEPTDEQLELVTPVSRREILKKYPNVFKDFPHLEKAYYREQQFTEIFPTIPEAREAAAAVNTLDNFEQDLLKGNTKALLESIKKESPNAFAKIADNYLMTLGQVDEAAFHHVIGTVTKQTIVEMVKEARASKNDALEAAAQLLNQFVFGTSEWKPPTKLSKEQPDKDGKENEVDQREKQYITERFETTRDDLNVKVNNTLKATIDGNIDPKDSMSEYVKKTASREALDQLQTIIQKDTRFISLVDRLWDDAFKKRFNKESVDRIRSAYLSKAKTLLPSVIKKARNDALKGMGKRVVEDTEETTPNKGPASTKGRSQAQNTSEKTKPGDIPSGMSTMDFLMKD